MMKITKKKAGALLALLFAVAAAAGYSVNQEVREAAQGVIEALVDEKSE